MTNAERIVTAAHTALDAGPLGNTKRPADYRALISCGFKPALNPPFESADIGTIKTSCAVFGRGILHAAGRKATKPGTVGQGIMGGWLERLTMWHPAWEWATDDSGKRKQPPAGALFYRDYSRTPGKLGHVGFLLFETTPGMWVTAEGGGGDGTECKLSNGPKDFFAKDILNRIPIGWWRPELLDGFSPEKSSPTGSPVPVEPPAEYRMVRLGDKDTGQDGPVRAWQYRLMASGVPGTELSKYGADGGFGPETLKATRALMAARLDGSTITKEIWDLVGEV